MGIIIESFTSYSTAKIDIERERFTFQPNILM